MNGRTVRTASFLTRIRKQWLDAALHRRTARQVAGRGRMSVIDQVNGKAAPSGVVPERSLGLAGSIIQAKYRVLAIASVSRDVVVYMAEELRFGRPITLKVLRDEVAGDAEFVAAARDQAIRLAMSAHVHRGL